MFDSLLIYGQKLIHFIWLWIFWEGVQNSNGQIFMIRLYFITQTMVTLKNKAKNHTYFNTLFLLVPSPVMQTSVPKSTNTHFYYSEFIVSFFKWIPTNIRIKNKSCLEITINPTCIKLMEQHTALSSNPGIIHNLWA